MKKYIIELDENKYKKMKKYIEQSGCSDYYDNAIAKAIPLEEEFEKILTEAYQKSCYIENKGSIYVQLCLLNRIIYNHISELKGE